MTYEDLVDYLVLSNAYDGKAMKSFRALFAYNYVQNGWLGDILSCTVDNIHYLKAKVSPSQPGVGRSDYSAWVAVAEDCSIITGHCTCPAGEGRSCSHMSAIAFAVYMAWTHGIAGEASTDKKRLWGHSASKSLLQEKFEDIDFNHPKPGAVNTKTTKKSSKTKLPKTKQILDHSDLQKHATESNTNLLWACKGTMLNKIFNAKERQVLETLPVQHTSHDIDESKPVDRVQCQFCNDFFQKYINLSDEQKNAISAATVSQSTTLWHDVRKLRLSSSKVHSLPKTSRADPEKFVNNHIYPRFKGNSATSHGLKHEEEARKWFQEETGTTVNKTGVIIDSVEPYLAASPDGLIDNDTIIEIKCPTKPLNELISSGKYDVVCVNGEYTLNPKGKNGYFTQVQMAMHCTGRKFCKFLVWTRSASVVVDVQYDKKYVDDTARRVRKFYFNFLLARLAEEWHSKRLKISQDYIQCCDR